MAWSAMTVRAGPLGEEIPVCPVCEGEGGTGDDRCAITICPACEGTGLAVPPSADPRADDDGGADVRNLRV
jgi:hypothetical protein